MYGSAHCAPSLLKGLKPKPIILLPLQGFPRLAPLLREGSYREAVLEGLIACIGGLDGNLRRAAKGALAEVINCKGEYSPQDLQSMIWTLSVSLTLRSVLHNLATVSEFKAVDLHSHDLCDLAQLQPKKLANRILFVHSFSVFF